MDPNTEFKGPTTDSMIHSPLTASYRSITYNSQSNISFDLNRNTSSEQLISTPKAIAKKLMYPKSKYYYYTCDSMIILSLLIISVLLLSQNMKPNQQIIPLLNGEQTQINFNFAYPYLSDTVEGMQYIAPILCVWYALFLFDAILLYCVDSHFNGTDFAKHLFVMLRMTTLCFTLTFIGTEIIKISVGSPRPMFLQSMSNNNNGRKSFISGHSALAMSQLSLLTLMLYQSHKYVNNQQNMNGLFVMSDAMRTNNAHSYYLCVLWYLLKDIPLLAMAVLFSPIYAGLYIGMTRITDYKHFKEDVIAGFVYGFCCAFVCSLIYRKEMYACKVL